MNELEIVDRLRSRFGGKGKGVVLGIGDDCAIYRPRGSSEDLVLTTDQTIEGVHFRKGTRASLVGEKALARALSDIAAMGADPRFCLISVSVPASFNLESFFRGVQAVASRYRLLVAGGDLARSRTFTCDICVAGAVPRGKALRRDHARPGDEIYVSGPLGAAAARGYKDVPQPQIAFGKKLRNRATACMDVSDGLTTDLYRLCVASGTGAFLHTVPTASGATDEQALNGGEDYQLLYTGRELPGIRIGVMNEGPAGLLTLHGDPLAPGGWDHFA